MSIDKKQLSKLVYYMSSFDGGVYKTGNECSFIMNMREENLDYVRWVADTLGNITSVKIKQQPDYNKDGCTRQPLVRLWTNSHPYFSKVRERIYIDNKKVLDPHMLTLMDDEALAIIFMADGSTGLDSRWTNPHCKIDLCTKGFSYFDNLALSKSIYEKCGICSSVHRHGKYYYLNIKSRDHLKFVDSILPHLKESFYYKLERIAPALEYKRGGDIVCAA